jgi:hypothetical protein
MKKCSYCGTAYPDEVSTCTIDGHPVVSDRDPPKAPELKSKVGGVVLAVICGPFGLFYASVRGAVVVLALSIVVRFATYNDPWLETTCIVSLVVLSGIWASRAIDEHNRKVLEVRSQAPPENSKSPIAK